jgi:multidrug efflux pump subunit AcrA (membrane-fusion protein)
MTDIMKDTPNSSLTAEPSPLPTGPSSSPATALASVPTPRASKRRRGVRAVGVLLGVSVLSGGGGWLVARRLSSPADVAARTAAPVASRIVAPVEFRVLRSTLFTRGTVRFGSPKPITLPGSASKTGSQIVTAPPVKGAVVKEGGKIADVSGRPVVGLVGSVPMYRDIRPNDSGDDVLALKASLNRLGFAAGSGPVFDEVAERAVSVWMRSIGYEPFGATPAQLDRLKLATDAVRKSTDQVRAAREALVLGTALPTADKTLAANEAVSAARDRVAAAVADASKADDQALLAIAQREIALATAEAAVVAADTAVARMGDDVSAQLTAAESAQNLAAAKQRVTDTELGVVKAERAIETANADADDARAAVVEAQTNVDEANAGLVRAQTDLVAAKAKTVPTIVIGDGASRADNEGHGASIRAAEQAITGATTSVRSATAGLRTAQRGVTRAETAIGDAQTTLATAKLQVATAKEAVTIAELRAKQATANSTSNGSSSASASNGAVSSAGAASTSSGSLVASPLAGSSTGSSATGTGAASGASSGLTSAANNGSGSDPIARQAQARKSRDIAALELDQAKRAVAPALRAQAAALRSAEAQLKIAIASREQLGRPANATSLRSAVTNAVAAEVDAKTELARLEAETGIVVPANEVVFFNALPLRIDESKLAAGDALSGVFMTVSTQRVAVDSSVDPADASGLRVGQDAEIEASDLQITLKAKITEIASSTGTKGAAAGRIYVELTPAEEEPAQPEPAASDSGVNGQPQFENRKPRLTDLNGLPVKVTVPVSSTGGKVLAVPTAAVSAAIDGTTRVEVEDSPGAPTRLVLVTAGLRAEGFVQITPTRPSDIKEGDTVVTGTSNGKLLEGVPGSNDKPGAAPAEAATNETVPVATPTA